MQGHRHDCWRRPDNVATGVAVLAGVGDVQLAPTQAGEQSLTSAQGTAAHRVLAFGVVRNQAEVPLIVRPAQITLMMIRDQHLPILALLLEAANHLLAAGLDADAAAGAPECIRASIDWVGQNVQDRVVDRQLPLDRAAFGAIGDGGQRNALVSESEVHLTHRLHLGELGEDERDRLADAPIRVLLDAVVADPHVADGDRHEQLARRAFCFGASSERWRSTDNSISLMVPFMPCSRRSLGCRRS
jgi:hypothetical protein